MAKKRVLNGLDVLVAENFTRLRNKRVGLVANPASVDRGLNHVVDLMFAALPPEGNTGLVRLFGPEHGIRGALQDMETEHTGVDLRTGLPVISLYGDSLSSLTPRREDIEDLEVIVFDLQDVGSRYYTFVQTLAYSMQIASECGAKVLVLDRVNPIGGKQIEGATLTAACRSFCGLYGVANRHGLTLGEFAKLMQRGFGAGEDSLPGIPCDLEVVQIEGWTRKTYFDETDLPWVQPSPNMPTLETALVYPGACLFEATNLSEGRGTTRPFELLGAPFIDGYQWIEETARSGISLEGCILRPLWFIPKFQKWANHLCGGVQIHVTNRQKFQPFRVGLALLTAAYQLYPHEFSWRSTTYEFIDEVSPIDLLFGSNQLRRTLESHKGLTKVLREMKNFEKSYALERQDFLLYN